MSSYYVEMAQRLKFAVAVPLLVLIAVLCGCKARTRPSTVVVHVLRNLSSPYGSELDRRILDFQGSNPRLPSGQPIVIQSETGDYKEMLQKQTSSSEDVEVIILDSPDDAQDSPAVQIALQHAANVCAGLKACPTNIPAIIPPQVAGVKRQAAQAFVDFLQKTP